MDIITQLQDQVNKIAFLAFNTLGTLQRDAPAVRLSNNYPDPAAVATAAPPPANGTVAGSAPSAAAPAAPAAAAGAPAPAQQTDQAPEMASALIQAAKQFDVLVAALPTEGGEEAQVKRIAELQAENDEVGKELRLELDAAEEELKQMRELFHTAADDCLRLKPLQ